MQLHKVIQIHIYFSDVTLEQQMGGGGGVVPKLFKLSLIFILEVR